MSIKILSQETINKLAAGELVHSAEHAIKELIENAVDAGASKVEVTIRDGRTVLVKDNGHGISPDNFPLLCVRFATSKLENYDALEEIGTFGFRGEALASLSYVADVSAESVHGHVFSSANYRDSNMEDFTSSPTEDASYTVIKVEFRDIEPGFRQTVQLIQEFELLNCDIDFSVVCGEKSIHLKQAPRDELITRYFDLPEGSAHQKVSFRNECFNFDLYMAFPSSKFQSLRQTVFINNRLLGDKELIGTLHGLLRSYVANQRYHFVFLLQADSGLVDFNCHVQKLRVLLLNEQDVFDEVAQSLQEFRQSGAGVLQLNQTKAARPAPPAATATALQQSPTSPSSASASGAERPKASSLKVLRLSELRSQIDYELESSAAANAARPQGPAQAGEQQLLLQYLLQTGRVQDDDVRAFYGPVKEYYSSFYTRERAEDAKVLNLRHNSSFDQIFIQYKLNLVRIGLLDLLSILISYLVVRHFAASDSSNSVVEIVRDGHRYWTAQDPWDGLLGFTDSTEFTIKYYLLQFGIKEVSVVPQLRYDGSEVIERIRHYVNFQLRNNTYHIVNKQQLINTLNDTIQEDSTIVKEIMSEGQTLSQNSILKMFDRV